MKKILIFILSVLWISPTAHAKDLTVNKQAGEYLVKIIIDKNPPILGENNIEIKIIDAAGTYKKDPRVMINYYMPPMPRMAPMNYKKDAKLKGEKYVATLNFIMSGPWIIRILIFLQGKRMTVKFNIDVQ